MANRINLPLEIFKAFNNNTKAITSLEKVTQTLTELFNFFEPAYFSNAFFVILELNNEPVLPKNKSKSITFDKEQLINQKSSFIIQIIENYLYLCEEFDISNYISNENLLIYKFESNREFFFANKKEFEITEQPLGSKFSNEFCELNKFLNQYAISKVRHSSCPIFNKSWNDEKRIFFKSGGKDIPESYMQKSIKNFIDDIRIFKGEIGQYEANREHILGAKKPVDILIKWEKSNRIAIIEIKWLGKSMNNKGKITSKHDNSRANEGYKQLKEYYELIKTDNPTKIIKCFLVVFDGRRWQSNETTTSISYANGMHYAEKELEIEDDKKYWIIFPNIEIPIRMFVEPICDL